MVAGVRLRLSVSVDLLILGKRGQQIAALNGRLGQQGSRGGDNAIERISHLRGETTSESEKRRRQLVVGDVALTVDQMVAFAAQISDFENPVSLYLLLDVQAPLLDDRISGIQEEAVPDGSTDIRERAAVRTRRGTRRKIESPGDGITQTG